jgi:hypothetical protein
LKYSASLVLLLCLSTAFGQKLKVDTVQVNWKPIGIRAGIDLIGLVKTQVYDDRTDLDFAADIALNKYLLALEGGRYDRLYEGETYLYEVQGTYFRVGIDKNFMFKDREGTALFLGLRHGRARVNHQITYDFTDRDWGLFEGNRRTANGLNANWMELVAGLRVRIYRELWMGYTGRLKFGLKAEDTGGVEIYDVPGYGLTSENSYWGFNYYLQYRIPFKKRG